MSALPTLRAVRLLVVDDNQAIRYLVGAMSARDPELTVVAEATNGQEAVAQATAHTPDVVLLDLEMPVMDGITAINPILAASPASKIVMYSAWEPGRDDALRAGAHAWITKGAQWTAIRAVLRDVMNGGLGY